VVIAGAGRAAAGLALCALACGARPRPQPRAGAGDDIVLYRDRALVIQRIEIVAERAGPATRALRLPAGVGAGDVEVIDRGELGVAGLRIADAAGDAPVRAPAHPPAEPSDDPIDAEAVPPPPPAATAPGEVELAVTAPHPGRFALAIGYTTDRLAWDAAYTMTTAAPARDRAVLRGALAIRNTTGITLHGRTRVVDHELGAARDRTADRLGRWLAAAAATGPRTAPDAEPCDLGVLTLGDGETRASLLAGAAPRRLRSVLVYDPIGTGLDHAGAVPVSDPALGAETAPPIRVSESFEIERDPRQARGMPAGPVRLLERRPDGSLELLGASRLFDPATRVADVDTVVVGTAQGVTGHRERRDWGKADDQRRFSEEFLITIDNARPRPVEVVLREHLYRGQNWTLAYQSAPAVKEGPQQIALRTTVPARGRAKVLYVVVYTW
jgi:hypothetical protein